MGVLLDLLLQIQKAKERVVLVSHFTQTLDLFEQLCAQHKFGCLRLDGRFASFIFRKD